MARESNIFFFYLIFLQLYKNVHIFSFASRDSIQQDSSWYILQFKQRRSGKNPWAEFLVLSLWWASNKVPTSNTHFLTSTNPPAPQRGQGENQKSKSMKTIMGQDRDSLVSERKRKKASDAKAITYNLLQADWCLASFWTIAAVERSSPSFIAEHSLLFMEYSLGQLLSIVPAVSPVNLLPTPAHLLGRQNEK